MDYFARRNLYNNNKSPPILLNDVSYNQKLSKNIIPRVAPSFSGNPQPIRNYKTNIYSSNNFYSTNNKAQTNNNYAILNSRYKFNYNYNNPKTIIDYAQYSRYIKPTNSFNNYNNNKYVSLNRIQNDTPNSNLNLHPSNLRSKILTLANNYQKKGHL